MQALYSFFKSNNNNLTQGEKLLFQSFSNVYELYISVLSVFYDLVHFANLRMEEGKQKKLPTLEDLNPNQKFIKNRLIQQLFENRALRAGQAQYHVNYANHQDLIKKIYLEMKESEIYAEYLKNSTDSYSCDKEFVINLFAEIILNNQLFIDLLDEKNIFTPDDYELVGNMVVRTITGFKQSSDENTPLMPLYKDKEDDLGFAKDLYRKTIINSKEYSEFISKRTAKWDAERIAYMDMLLMKMALCEFLEFPTVPVRATMDEYIDISKNYSTPKSSVFINGILDNMLAELKEENRINKLGRGLIDK